MPMVPFSKFYLDLAKAEIRSATVGTEWGLPSPGPYAFFESYCDEQGCDCRRVILTVLSPQVPGVVATISFGFDPGGDMRGPFLDPINPQSEHAEAALALTEYVLEDADYVARLERHYHLVKDAIQDQRPADQPWWKRKRKKPKRGG